MAFSRGFSRPRAVGLVSAVLTVIGTVLPWVTAGLERGPLPGEASADAVGLAILTLLFSIIALALVLFGGSESREPVGIIGYGLVIGGIGLWQLLVLGGTGTPGVGLYLTLVGGVGLLGAGVWGYQSELTEPTGATVGQR